MKCMSVVLTWILLLNCQVILSQNFESENLSSNFGERITPLKIDDLNAPPTKNKINRVNINHDQKQNLFDGIKNNKHIENAITNTGIPTNFGIVKTIPLFDFVKISHGDLDVNKNPLKRQELKNLHQHQKQEKVEFKNDRPVLLQQQRPFPQQMQSRPIPQLMQSRPIPQQMQSRPIPQLMQSRPIPQQMQSRPMTILLVPIKKRNTSQVSKIPRKSSMSDVILGIKNYFSLPKKTEMVQKPAKITDQSKSILHNLMEKIKKDLFPNHVIHRS